MVCACVWSNNKFTSECRRAPSKNTQRYRLFSDNVLTSTVLCHCSSLDINTKSISNETFDSTLFPVVQLEMDGLFLNFSSNCCGIFQRYVFIWFYLQILTWKNIYTWNFGISTNGFIEIRILNINLFRVQIVWSINFALEWFNGSII